mgnify:CR=1 FL=1
MSRQSRPIHLIMACLLVAALLLAACAPTATAPGGTTKEAAPAGKTAAEDLDPNQEYRGNLGGDPPSLDPNASAWDTSIAVIALAFEGLLRFKEDLTLEPAVAKEVPSTSNGGISADGKTYTAARILLSCVQTLENDEDFVGKLRVYADPVVPD